MLGRVFGVQGHVVVGQVTEVDVGFAVATAEADRELGLSLLARQLSGIDSGRAELLELFARQGHPGGLGDAPPIRIAAVQRRLYERRVGYRPRDPLGFFGRGRALNGGATNSCRTFAV